MNPASLDNLKAGAIARRREKIKCSVTLLPETKAWLERGGNISARIDEIVAKIQSGELVHRPRQD